MPELPVCNCWLCVEFNNRMIGIARAQAAERWAESQPWPPESEPEPVAVAKAA